MAATNFATCLTFTLRYEGGRANNPKDPGGRTNEGVTQRTYSAWLAKHGLQSRDVYALPDAERDSIYRGGFRDAVKADAIPDGADLAVFDFGVNSGPARALKAYATRTSNDGAVIAKTVCANRLSFLHALGTFSAFGKGWTARVAACEATGFKMAEHARIGVPVDAPTAPQVSSKLIVEASKAKAKAGQHKAAAAVVAGAGAATGTATTQTPVSPATIVHVPWPVIALAVLVAAAGIALLLWRAKVQGARANAYTDAAKTTLTVTGKKA